MSKVIQWMADGYAFTDKVANQKTGVEMRLDGDDVSAVDFEGAYDCIISEARVIVEKMKEHFGKDVYENYNKKDSK